MGKSVIGKITVSKYVTYFEFIQYSLGIKDTLPTVAAEIDWADFYKFARKQSLSGVVFEGIQSLPKELAPRTDLLMRWMGECVAVRNRNSVMYRASRDVYASICKVGYRCCVLKGQGNALMYPNPYSRMSGDIDVWIPTDNREELRRVALILAGSADNIKREIVHHIELERDGVSVELHPTPMMFNNPVLNHRMQRWFKRNVDLQCGNIVELSDGVGEIAVPTSSFNVIYQLCHLYHHFFYEGMGMRQVIDYYYVLMGLPQNSQRTQIFWANTNCTNNTNVGDSPSVKSVKSVGDDLKRLGLWNFAGAVMWVLRETLGLLEERMIVPVDERRGRLLLAEIIDGGNFGQHGHRRRFGRGTIGHNIQRLCRDARLAWYYPAEALCEPLFRTWHFFWRKMNKV